MSESERGEDATVGEVLGSLGFSKDACLSWLRKLAKESDVGFLPRQAEYHLLAAAEAKGHPVEQTLLGISLALENDCAELNGEMVNRARMAAQNTHHAERNRVQREIEAVHARWVRLEDDRAAKKAAKASGVPFNEMAEQ